MKDKDLHLSIIEPPHSLTKEIQLVLKIYFSIFMKLLPAKFPNSQTKGQLFLLYLANQKNLFSLTHKNVRSKPLSSNT